MIEDERVGLHPGLNAHELEQTMGDSEGQGSLAYGSPWGHKELEMTVTEQGQNSDFEKHFDTFLKSGMVNYCTC